MRTKILMLGSNPSLLMADTQLLRERGMLVITAFNMENINEMADEVRPDIVFFDPHQPRQVITDAYNTFIANMQFSNIPVIYTLSDDDVYLITRKREAGKKEQALIADNIIDAIQIALTGQCPVIKFNQKIPGRNGNIPNIRTGQLFG